MCRGHDVYNGLVRCCTSSVWCRACDVDTCAVGAECDRRDMHNGLYVKGRARAWLQEAEPR